MTNNTTWIRRVTAGVFLVAAPALIALGTASASHADAATSQTRHSAFYAPAQKGSLHDWNQGSWHQRHQAEQQAKYR